MGKSSSRMSGTSTSGATARKSPDARGADTTAGKSARSPSDERVGAKITFVVHGGEVLAIFRAIRDPEGKWQKETPYIGACTGRLCLDCYAHVGQHDVCDPSLLKCRRAKPEEYLPLKRELEEIVGYNVEVVQHGRLRLKEETGYAACWLDENDNGAALDPRR